VFASPLRNLQELLPEFAGDEVFRSSPFSTHPPSAFAGNPHGKPDSTSFV